MPSYEQQTSQPVKHAGIYSIAHSRYLPPQTYDASAASHPYPIAPNTARVSSPHGPEAILEAELPTHVIGSQGRPRRSKTAIVFERDSDGRYLCPDCNKPFTNRDFLTRHRRKHTGDRPHMCDICGNAFSRGDVLKRHFRKCSVRRENQSEASHLSCPQPHTKKNQRQAQNAASLCHEDNLYHSNGLSYLPANNIVQPFGLASGRLEQHNSMYPGPSGYGTPPDMKEGIYNSADEYRALSVEYDGLNGAVNIGVGYWRVSSVM
ncbi:hypothetical protein FBULB1_5913 [Fusarium bulbicola]|nr:hypothetical protein FBULB1_5913 [Fusarium bulbicola]